MKVKKVPMRTCVVTGEKLEKKDLIRIVRTPEKEVKIDLSGKMNGRGCYLKMQEEVVLKAKKSKILNKKLEIEVPDVIYEEVLEIISKN